MPWMPTTEIVFACGDRELLSEYPEIAATLREPEGMEIYTKRLRMPEGAVCSRCGPNTAAYWQSVCRMIEANAGADWPITQREIGPLRPRVLISG